jgi:uncharacterized RDD family membrane protein YckC
VQYVSVGRRFVAIFIDGLILGLVGFRWINFEHIRTPDGLNTYSFHYNGGGLFASLLLMVVYFTVMEGTLGATVGKLAMGIRVVQEDGSKCTWQGATIRNLVRVVEWFTGYLLAAILVWISPTRQRLGDRAANTVVIRKGSNTGIGSGTGGTGSAATMNWPTPAAPGGVTIPPPPPPPPIGAPPGDQPAP